jgi:hypothetical protein
VGLDCFVIGSALTGKLVSLFDYRAILLMLSLGVASMLLGMLLKPSVMPQGSRASRKRPAGGLADAGAAKLALSRLRLSAAGGARRLLRL